MQRHYSDFRERGAELYTISVDPPDVSKREVVQGLGAQFPVLSDQNRETITAYGVLSIANIAKPSAFVIDRNGIIQYKSIGDTTNRESIETLIEELEKLSVSEVFNLSVPAGTSLVHLPYVVTGVNGESRTITEVSDLFDILGGEANVNWLITTPAPTRGDYTQFQAFFRYSDADILANASIHSYTGILVSLRNAMSIDLTGDPVEGAVRLFPGPNLVGIPHEGAGINRVSDFAKFPGFLDQIEFISVYANGTFHPFLPDDIASGAPNDLEILPGQAIAVVAKGNWFQQF